MLGRTLGKTFDEVCQISKAELIMWMADYNLDCWGEAREDLRNAINCYTSASAAGCKNIRPEQFIINYDEPKLTPEQYSENEAICKSFFSNWEKRQKKKKEINGSH